MNKKILLLFTIISLVTVSGFLIINNELNNVNLKIDFLEKQLYPKFLNSDTTCGDGTVEIDGICYAPKKIEYKI